MLTTLLAFGAGIAAGMVLAVLLAMASEYGDWTRQQSPDPQVPVMTPAPTGEGE
jgi:hypothetical protein